jgi:hypothetical protein
MAARDIVVAQEEDAALVSVQTLHRAAIPRIVTSSEICL